MANEDIEQSMNIEESVKNLIKEHLGVTDLELESSFIDDLGADSLDMVELVMAFEETFDVQIPDEEAEKIVTVQHALDYIQTRRKTQNITPSSLPAQGA